MEDPTILVVIDLEQTDHPSLDRAAELAQSMHASVELYSCEVDPGFPASELGPSGPQHGWLCREARLQLLEQLAARLRSLNLRATTRSTWQGSAEAAEGALLRYVVARKPVMVLEDELYTLRQRWHRATAESLAAEPLA